LLAGPSPALSFGLSPESTIVPSELRRFSDEQTR
jgi:hypothetical protein